MKNGNPDTCRHCGAPLTRQLDLAEALTPVAPERKARNSDPSTSHDAARLAFPRAASQRHRILAELRHAVSGLTAEQLASQTHMPYVSASTRISELKQGGWVEVVGVRTTTHGARADVLALTPQAVAALDQAVAA